MTSIPRPVGTMDPQAARPPGHAPNPHTPDGAPADAEYVVYRLEEAGSTLLALPEGGYSTRMRTSKLEVVRACLDAYGWDRSRARPAPPSPAQITRMDEALAWIGQIADDRYVLRRIVGARALVSPLTGRHLYSWRRLAGAMGADHKAIQRWHAQGIGLLVAALNRPGPARPGPARVSAGPSPDRPALPAGRAAGCAE